MMFRIIVGAVLLAGVVYLRYRSTAVRRREKRRRTDR
jgi:hypothetical protein